VRAWAQLPLLLVMAHGDDVHQRLHAQPGCSQAEDALGQVLKPLY
jgi:hypothetical protein